MSMMNQPGAGAFTALCEVFGEVMTSAHNARARRLARRVERAGEDLGLLEEEIARERHRAWLAAVERQARENRWAGDATEAQARAALSGKRPNPIDERKFR
jgi:hypothetical protein